MHIGRLAGALLSTALVSTTALAQSSATPAAAAAPTSATAAAPQAEATAPKRVTVTTGLDFASAYMFRGIRQHSGGAIVQPAFDLGVALGKGVSLNVGNWDSVHSTGPMGKWYESDYYGSVTFTAGKLKPALLYTSYTSPTDSFKTVHELAGVFSFDDSSNPLPLSPKVVLAFELGDGQADAGAEKGVYLELGVKPAFKLAEKLSLLVPVKAGLSPKSYYEGSAGNTGFGYFDTGLILSVPAASGKNGSLEIHGGVDFLWLRDTLKAFNGGDGFKPVGLLGFTYTY